MIRDAEGPEVRGRYAQGQAQGLALGGINSKGDTVRACARAHIGIHIRNFNVYY